MYVEGIKGIFLWSQTITKCYKTRVSRPFRRVVLQDHATNYNDHISTTTVPTTTKPGRLVSYLEGLLPIKLPVPFGHCQNAHDHETWQGGDLP